MRIKMPENIFLFVPNIIDYGRIVALLTALYYSTTPTIAAPLYLISLFLDEFDGYAARTLNQTSSFGATLDMIIDRVSTLGLFIVLATFYNQYSFCIQLLVILDIASHWMYVYSTLLGGEENHKSSKNYKNRLLKFYYTNPSFMFIVGMGSELCLISIYLQYYSIGPLIALFGIDMGLWQVLFGFTAPIFVLKQIINVIQLLVAAIKIVEVDQKKRD